MRANIQGHRSSWLSVTLLLVGVVLVVGILYSAREFLIPIALAVLLTFILSPIVAALSRHGVERRLSVVLTVVLTFAVLGGIGATITLEFRGLANELPKYRQNIRKKISDVRLAGKGGPIEKVQETVNEVIDEIKKAETSTTSASPAVPVVVTNHKSVVEPGLPKVGPLLEPLASAGLVIVLVIFMLLRREDLRDRLLRLAGYGRLATTTKALDEAGKRVSKYLLRQCVTNAAFGVAMGTGLFFIGLPYALLWGFLAAVARFIPYVGPWLGALAPILTSLAVFDSWMATLLVIGLVTGLELITNLAVEPMLYGQSIGVSEVALLIMMAFWTWLWGSIGLVLAAPLTVCLLVISAVEGGVVLGCPANDEADELALLMLAELLRTEGWTLRVLSSQMLSSECLAEVEKAEPALVCLGFLGRGPILPIRQLCKRLRTRAPQLPVVVGCWGVEDREKIGHHLTGLATSIGWGLDETKNQVVHLARITPVAIPFPDQRPAPTQPNGLPEGIKHKGSNTNRTLSPHNQSIT